MFNQVLAKQICAGLADGKSLRAVCEEDGMPSEAAVRAWALDDVEGFAAQYARAREIGYARLADELVEIADQDNADTYVDENGNAKVNGEVVARSRLRVDTRKWMLSKMLPKVYGEKVEQTIQGPGGGPIESKMTVEFVRAATQSSAP